MKQQMLGDSMTFGDAPEGTVFCREEEDLLNAKRYQKVNGKAWPQETRGEAEYVRLNKPEDISADTRIKVANTFWASGVPHAFSLWDGD